jgi:rfaE bifunctional protein nucleotidyltransferase chain/domain/rfaE bifunctional protein kinase chain/domain
MSLVVVGDALLDRDLDGVADRLAPDAPVPVLEDVREHARPGGAGLAAVLAAASGVPTTLICALGDDDAGRRLAALLDRAGVRVCDLGLHGQTPEKVRVRAGGRPLARLDAGGAASPCGPLTAEAREALAGATGVLVSDYGRGVAAEPALRRALAALRHAPLVWDPHPRGPEPVEGALLVTPNAAEAGVAGAELAAVEARARELACEWRAVDVCITLGARGALLVGGEAPAFVVPAPAVGSGDPCGAGDCFASTAALRLAAGAGPAEAVHAAVEAASRFVAGGGAATAGRDATAAPARDAAGGDARALAASVRAAGGTVVATGGCFDLLHAGHVRSLEAARSLGDCLIVCLNSDASVRRLKGPDRPLVPQADRAAVLEALSYVDAVAVFEEDDPRAILRELRPHVWAKGGDYAARELPEAAVLREWGGHVVLVRHVPGRSTTGLIEQATRRRSATARREGSVTRA